LRLCFPEGYSGLIKRFGVLLDIELSVELATIEEALDMAWRSGTAELSR